jgi:hypothetical protein
LETERRSFFWSLAGGIQRERERKKNEKESWNKERRGGAGH